ncbi:hypothetical protein ZIOFF_068487 [Zingiber officinale]|uniref:Apyrase 6 n=1 Tax=Zingiber officinale TaxID=94328 RepID=A0A8J5CH10_ZINOF|nr:hypothetical protein ZIOFF_068487 [Zingiber officinale]
MPNNHYFYKSSSQSSLTVRATLPCRAKLDYSRSPIISSSSPIDLIPSSKIGKLESPSSTHNPYRRCIWISVSFLSLAFLLLYIVVSSRNSTSARFGIAIDGGSSGTRIHIFSSKGIMGGFPLLDLKSMAVMRKTPRLSSYLGDPELSEESLVELLEFAKEKVPNDWHKVTEVRLMATAGLRMVEVGLRERILESCRRVLRLSGF